MFTKTCIWTFTALKPIGSNLLGGLGCLIWVFLFHALFSLSGTHLIGTLWSHTGGTCPVGGPLFKVTSVIWTPLVWSHCLGNKRLWPAAQRQTVEVNPALSASFNDSCIWVACALYSCLVSFEAACVGGKNNHATFPRSIKGGSYIYLLHLFLFSGPVTISILSELSPNPW